MKVAIRYYTRGGNTKKLAGAISKAVGAEAKTTAEPLPLPERSYHKEKVPCRINMIL